MKFRIEAERREFLSMVVEAENEEQAKEAAAGASRECWDQDPEEDDLSLTEVGEAGEEEEAFWVATGEGELEPYDDPAFQGEAGE